MLIPWLLLSAIECETIRTPAAFVAGVAGLLVGGHLLHVRKTRELATGLASIDGAGTFDGISFARVVTALIAQGGLSNACGADNDVRAFTMPARLSHLLFYR